MRRIVIGVSDWRRNAACDYSAGLARALAAKGSDVSILVTEPGRSLAPSNVPCAEGVILRSLPRTPYDDWSATWLGLIRDLEENAPTVYLSSQDWTAACVIPRLSTRVITVGLLHDSGRDEQEHCFRLGKYFNAVVAIDPVMRQRVMVEHQVLASRLAAIHHPASSPDGEGRDSAYRWDDLAERYLALFDELEANVKSGRFRRRRGKMVHPPARVFEASGKFEVARAVATVNSLPMWPDPPASRGSAPTPAKRRGMRQASRSLKDHRIVLSVPTGRISGVDIFTISLARELVALGYGAEIVQTSPGDRVFDSLPIAGDVPVAVLDLREHPTWPERWRAMRRHLEVRAPCIYVPNYDTRHSCVAPVLSSDVKVVGIAHSDDPHHYDHIARLAPWWDGVVGVSGQITETISKLAPELAPRIRTIPYGVRVPREFAGKPRGAETFLRAVYAGRVTQYQKRALDLLSVGRILQENAARVEITIIGNGPDASTLVSGLPQLALTRHMRWVGSLPNDTVLDVFADSDVFVLPSSFEGLPVSLLEAMAQGCVPVVTASRSGVTEIVEDGVNGFIVPVGDVEAMAERLETLEADDALLLRMRQAAWRTIREGGYRTSEMAAAYVEFLEGVVADPRERIPGRIVRPPELTRLDAHVPRFPLRLRKTVWSLRRAVRRVRGATA